MEKNHSEELKKNIINQYHIINELYNNLSCDLYVCFEGEEEIEKLNRKLNKLKQIKKQLIKIYSTLVAEF